MKLKKVLLYPRVSSDEQSEKGYSLRDQEDKLINWCAPNNRISLSIFREDYSAWKGFNRPEWNKIIEFIKSNRGVIDEVLFTRWDRFSRNAPEAYNMIDTLRKLGVTPFAIEQPIDMAVPENKMMLAFYLALPEVENDRRSINTIAGLRRAKSEGNYAGCAPVGYLNAKDERKKPILIIDQDRKHLIKQIFVDYTKGKSLFQIHKEVSKKGFNNTGREAIKRVLTNHTYTGMILIKAYGTQKERLVKGIHDPIINEDLFWAANARLKVENKTSSKVMKDELPLRGVLFCEGCGNLLTGSRSRGKTGKYFWYYRCYKGCKQENYYSKFVHSHLVEMLGSMSIPSEQLKEIIEGVAIELEEQMKEQNHSLSILNDQRASLKKKLSSWKDKYADDKITHEEYVEMKLRFIAELNTCEDQIQRLSRDEDRVWEHYKKTVPMLSDMTYVWNKSELPDKQLFIRSLFPSSLSYQNSKEKRGCNESHKPFATPFLFEPFASNSNTIRNLRLRNGSNLVSISKLSPVRVDDGTMLQLKYNQFEEFLNTVSRICA